MLYRHDGASGVARAAQVEQFTALPLFFRNLAEVRQEPVARSAVQEQRRGAGEQRRAFIDLVEGIRADDQRALCYDGLCERKQGLACAVHREYLAVSVNALQLEAAL